MGWELGLGQDLGLVDLPEPRDIQHDARVPARPGTCRTHRNSNEGPRYAGMHHARHHHARHHHGAGHGADLSTERPRLRSAGSHRFRRTNPRTLLLHPEPWVF